MDHSSSESRPKARELAELDMAEVVARQLIQLFGDEDVNIRQTDASIVKRKRKLGYHTCNIANGGAEIPECGEKIIMKKQRYRSIDNLYLATKPINVLEGKRCYDYFSGENP